MSSKNPEDESLSSSCPDEVESPRKKMRLDNPASKGWSLTARRTDHEVLQEMGVSLLEPDDDVCDTSVTLHHKILKRKRDIENVNPNVNSVTSPRGKRSPLKTCSPSPGPSRGRSPRSGEKAKPLQPSEQHLLETTLVSPYLVDEDTPLAQITHYAPPTHTHVKSVTPQSAQEPAVRSAEPWACGADSFSVLSDEMLLSVFRWLPKRALAHCMLVCKRWHRVACDETLWTRLDLGNKSLAKNALGRILARKPIIVRLANSEIGPWHPTTQADPSRIQYLDLSIATIDRSTLNCLLERCPLLKKLSLESVSVDDDTCQLIGKCPNLETLNLTMAQGITAEGLRTILEGCVNLQALNISWCNLTEQALQVLVTMLPQRLQRLNLGGARIMTDDMVSALVQRCPRLLELDLSDCSALGAAAALAVCSLARLEHLALSRCYLLPPHVLTKLSAMSSLQYLEVWGMLQTSSLNALRAALPAIQLNQFMFSAIARPTVGTRRTSIWGLRTRD